ncbi:MAG: hypothetical protein KAT28_05210 [Candidatus Aenigmarchaeota archaeon]|nr:hypothetical protein [Candidatus Aenigmarchaeota archaeon]
MKSSRRNIDVLYKGPPVGLKYKKIVKDIFNRTGNNIETTFVDENSHYAEEIMLEQLMINPEYNLIIINVENKEMNPHEIYDFPKECKELSEGILIAETTNTYLEDSRGELGFFSSCIPVFFGKHYDYMPVLARYSLL